MNIHTIKSIYFLGAGGIGMSALIRYFLFKGKQVAGYDSTPTPLTAQLISEGADIHYIENISLIPPLFRDPSTTLVVYTPAVPDDHREMIYFREHGFEIVKRARVLGELTRGGKGLCVAGTHGKTTTTAMTAHLLYQSAVGCSAFIGGITKNYNSNLLLSHKSEYIVIEADEFDRSFHQLNPYMSVITATDADHLDIYGTEEAYVEGFRYYTSLIREGGALIIHEGLQLKPNISPGVSLFTYGRENGDFHGTNIRIGGGEIVFDFVTPQTVIRDVKLGVPIEINIENGIAAMALAHLNGVSDDEIRHGMASYSGVDRRFDFQLKHNRIVFLSDYAHHPKELEQSILSIRHLYGNKKITGVFQPHLYTRTRDFHEAFAASLSLLDEVILTDIYPAREEPIEGISSKLIYDELSPGVEKSLCKKENLIETLRGKDLEMLIILGAGNINDYVDGIKQMLEDKYINKA